LPPFLPDPLGIIPPPGGLFPPVPRDLGLGIPRDLGLGTPRGALLCLGVLGPPLRPTCFVCAMIGYVIPENAQNGVLSGLMQI
jgi:hypothetical protein